MKQFLLFLPFLFSFYTVIGQCPESSLTLTSQAEIDAFTTNYPDCTELLNALIISGSDIENLEGLSNIASVHSVPNGNVENGIEISDNPNLTSLSGLSSISSFDGYVDVVNNPLLENLDGLGGLTTSYNRVRIENNTTLTSLSGLNIESICALIIKDNPNLTNLIGLESLQTVESLAIDGNNNLENLSGLENLTYSTEFIAIRNNPSLTSMIGISNIDTNDGVQIINNPLLENLEGLENLTTLFDVQIEDNANLISFFGLHNMTSLYQNLTIKNNNSLVDLNGLESLEYVEDHVFIEENNALESLSGLDSFIGVEFFEIRNNPNLSACSIDSVCASIINNTNYITISNNAVGCNSEEEVEEACLLGINEASISSIKIYPNPVVGTMNISLEPNVQVQGVDVFSVTGEKILTTQDTYVDVSSISNGVYFVHINTNLGTITKKIVKK